MDVRFLGTTDDVTTCDCCGRADLKSTVALDVDGAVVHYGSDCAARAIGRSAKDVRAATRAADQRRIDAKRIARDAAHASYMARWSAFLATAAPKGHDIFTRIESLGGMRAARELFRASPYAAPADR